MKEKANIPYSVITEGVLNKINQEAPFWAVALIMRIHHFNARRNESYALYLDKESIKLRITPEVLVKMLERLKELGELSFEKVNSGLFLISLSDENKKSIEYFL